MSELRAANTDLPTLNRELNHAWEASGLSPEGLFPFELALEEVFVNAITHGAQAGETRQFQMVFSHSGARANERSDDASNTATTPSTCR
jgi:two-component sensor histidine kinase